MDDLLWDVYLAAEQVHEFEDFEEPLPDDTSGNYQEARFRLYQALQGVRTALREQALRMAADVFR